MLGPFSSPHERDFTRFCSFYFHDDLVPIGRQVAKALLQNDATLQKGGYGATNPYPSSCKGLPRFLLRLMLGNVLRKVDAWFAAHDVEISE